MNDLVATIDLLKASLLYRELKAEHEEILKHKWYESERAGHDIGFNAAMFDWKLKHYTLWKRGRLSVPGAGFQN